MRRRAYLLLLLIVSATTSTAGADFQVGFGDDCSGARVQPCFFPSVLTISPGDRVTFFVYSEWSGEVTGNVVADDGSFRCAKGCDGEGGDGSPDDYGSQWRFTRQFDTPGIVRYHDQLGEARGVITVLGTPPVPISPAFSGIWYDPDQSGHGLVIEVLPANHFSATWLAFNPAGTGQAWFSGVGTYSGGFAETQVTQPLWMHPYGPSLLTLREIFWGTFRFTFTDCNHGRVDFNTLEGQYGSGTMNLTRLTLPAGLTCP